MLLRGYLVIFANMGVGIMARKGGINIQVPGRHRVEVQRPTLPPSKMMRGEDDGGGYRDQRAYATRESVRQCCLRRGKDSQGTCEERRASCLYWGREDRHPCNVLMKSHQVVKGLDPPRSCQVVDCRVTDLHARSRLASSAN